VGKVYNLCRVKTDISVVVMVKSGFDPHMIIELEDELNRGPYLWLMWISLLCIQCKDRSLELMHDSWISRYVLTLSIVFHNLHLVPCMFYLLGIMERISKDLEKTKESRRRS
jgi:hypothetical protein